MTTSLGPSRSPISGQALTSTKALLRNTAYVVTNLATAAVATVYSDEDLTTRIATPITSNEGVFTFYVPNGRYSIDFTTALTTNPPEPFTVRGLDNSPTVPAGITASRPTLAAGDTGAQFYDTTLNKLITWNGAVWKDGAAASV